MCSINLDAFKLIVSSNILEFKVDICHNKVPLLIFKAVKSPKELLKTTIPSLIIIDNFLKELMNDFSVLYDQIFSPLLNEKQFKLLLVSITKNLSL